MIDIGEFGHVRTARAADLIQYLEAANALPGVQRCKQIALAGLGLRPGQAVLDAGCGYGADVAEMAALVDPAGRAVGIDASGAMIAAARQRFAGNGLPATFETADVCGLGFPGASFDACRAERLSAEGLADEWAYAQPYASETARRAALPGWLHDYNNHLGHTALRSYPPASRVPNLSGRYT